MHRNQGAPVDNWPKLCHSFGVRRRFSAGWHGVLSIEPRAAEEEYDEGQDVSAEPLQQIAVVCIEGPIEQRAGWFGPGFDSIRACFEAALASDAVAVILKINSPGGAAAGNIECARAMVAAKEKSGKPVWTFADEAAYSAAYALACVGDKIFLPESGGVGSIGCLCVAADMVKMAKMQGVNAVVVRSGEQKAEGHPLIPLTDATLARFQSRVDSLAGGFAEFVSEERGVSPKRLLSLQGACFYGKDAVTKGLADGVMSWDAMVEKLAAQVVPLDGMAQRVSSQSRGSKTTLHEASRMTLEQMKAALAAAQAAGNTAKVKSLQAKIAAKKAEEADEDEEEEKNDDESKKSSAPPPPKKPDGDDDDDDDDEDSEEDADEPEEEEEETKKTTTVKTYRRSKKAQASLGASVAELFPGLTTAQINGRIAAMKQSDAATSKLRAEMDDLKREQRASKVNALISSGRKAGKITKAQEESLRAQGMAKNGLNWLREFLDATPARVTTLEDAGVTPSLDTPMTAGGVTVLENTICTRMGVAPADFVKQKQAGTTFVLTRSST